MTELQTQKLLEQRVTVDFPIPIGREDVKDLFDSLSEKIPCSIRHYTNIEGIVDVSNQGSKEFPPEMTAKVLARPYMLSSQAFYLLKNSHNPPLFTGFKFSIGTGSYGDSDPLIKFIGVMRENTKRYFSEKKTPKT